MVPLHATFHFCPCIGSVCLNFTVEGAVKKQQVIYLLFIGLIQNSEFCLSNTLDPRYDPRYLDFGY